MVECTPVLSKHDFVRRYAAGEFGNRSPTWNTLSDLLKSDYRGRVHLRNRIAGGSTYYDITVIDAAELWNRASRPENWYCSAMAPHYRGLIQGEVQQGVRGLELFYAHARVPMREALAAEGKQVSGATAVATLKYSMCPNSWEWLNILLDRYPEHVVEFSCFDKPWGTIPNYNTVIWEVRQY